MELIVDMLSQPCRSTYMFIKKNHLPVEIKNISLLNGEQYTEQFVKVNPLKHVPALTDGDFSMGESIPMMEYLAEKFHTPDHWFPKDLKNRVRVNQFLSWHHLNIRLYGSKVFWMKLMVPVVFKIAVPQSKMAEALEDLNSSLDVIENVFIQDGGFIGGDQISVADLVAIAEIMHPVGSGLDVFKDRPELSAWRDRVVKAVGKELFDEAHKKIVSAPEFAKTIDGTKAGAFKTRVLRLFGIQET